MGGAAGVHDSDLPVLRRDDHGEGEAPLERIGRVGLPVYEISCRAQPVPPGLESDPCKRPLERAVAAVDIARHELAPGPVTPRGRRSLPSRFSPLRSSGSRARSLPFRRSQGPSNYR